MGEERKGSGAAWPALHEYIHQLGSCLRKINELRPRLNPLLLFSGVLASPEAHSHYADFSQKQEIICKDMTFSHFMGKHGRQQIILSWSFKEGFRDWRPVCTGMSLQYEECVDIVLATV